MNRQTVATFNIVAKEITLAKTHPYYVQTTPYGEDKQAMHKAMWYVLHSPKLAEVHIYTSYYSKDILSMVRYCEMIDMPIDVHVHNPIVTSYVNQKFYTSAELQTWFVETQQTKEELAIARECIDLMVQYAPELLKIAKRSNDELIETLRSQVYASGYDVSMQSIFNQDGLNSGVIEDKFGHPQEWSRTYTKRYERYTTSLKDLLLMYISCKFYAQHDFDEPNHYGISESDIDSYTGEVIADPIQIRVHDEDVVVPQSACSLGVQNFMS